MAPPVVEPLATDSGEGIAFTIAPIKKEEKPVPLPLASLLDDKKEKKKDKGKEKERDEYDERDRRDDRDRRDKEKDRDGKRKKDKEADSNKKRKLSAMEEIRLREQVMSICKFHRHFSSNALLDKGRKRATGKAEGR